MFRALLACLFLAACSAPTAPPIDTTASPKFIGVLVLYIHGEYVSSVTSNRTYSSIPECLNVANATITGAKEAGKIPEGGDAIGACMPIPTLKQVPPVHEPSGTL